MASANVEVYAGICDRWDKADQLLDLLHYIPALAKDLQGLAAEQDRRSLQMLQSPLRNSRSVLCTDVLRCALPLRQAARFRCHGAQMQRQAPRSSMAEVLRHACVLPRLLYITILPGLK